MCTSTLCTLCHALDALAQTQVIHAAVRSVSLLQVCKQAGRRICSGFKTFCQLDKKYLADPLGLSHISKFRMILNSWLKYNICVVVVVVFLKHSLCPTKNLSLEYIPPHHSHSQVQKRACLVSGRRNGVPLGTDAGGPSAIRSSQPSHVSAANITKWKDGLINGQTDAPGDGCMRHVWECTSLLLTIICFWSTLTA